MAKLHHIEVELKARSVAQRSWESAPILNGEQPKAAKDSEVALNDASSELILQLLYRIENGLIILKRFVLASAHTRWPPLRGTYRLSDEV